MSQASNAKVLQAIRNKAREGDEQAALAALQKILVRNPNDINALLILASLAPNEKVSIAALKRVLQLDPDNETARRGLAEIGDRKQRQQADREGDEPSTPSQPVEDQAAEEPRIEGTAIVALAKSVTWPFKDLNRPVGELLESGKVTARDLGWASWNAYDPIVKWAAAVCLKAKDLEDVSQTPSQARQVIWPFKNLERPMGELLDEHIITLHDLAYAVTNAHDPTVRDAAATLGAQIVRPQVDAPPVRAAPELASVAQAPDVSSDGEKEENGTEAATRRQEDRPSNGQLHVVRGSAYLLRQEKRKAQQKRILSWFGIAFLIFAVGGGILGVVASLVGFKQLSAGWMGISVVMLAVAWWLIPRVARLRMEARNFAKGRRGEQRLVAFLREELDGHWVLFRSVVLPGYQGDLDAVLIGPRGIYALEVKAYSGYHRNEGNKWQKRLLGVWRTVDSNPTRQALRNAQRLHDYLETQGIDVWVEPRVVWAGSGRVWLEHPAVPVWQFSHPEHIWKDLRDGKPLSPELVRQLVSGVVAARRARG
ncbi:MAG: hypothetical protein DRI48_06080 [Chloroflexi bacterium]|nr:MAG: hypothetical protein DRI48_06080 [Chloroflexota bacterium]